MSEDAPVHPAATVVPLREGRGGLEVLLLRRNAKLVFHGGAWAETPWAVVVVSLVSAVFAARFGERIRSGWRAYGARRTIEATPHVTKDDVLIVPARSLFCFVAGFASPRIFVSQAAWAKLDETERQALVAHERAQRNGPSYLPSLRNDILEVIRKYVEVEPDAIKISVGREQDCEILELNVTLPERHAAMREGTRPGGAAAATAKNT